MDSTCYSSQQTDLERLVIYTITDHPSDFPENFVVRRHIIGKAGQVQADQNFLMLTKTLEEAQFEMIAMGLAPLPREEGDDPVIVESWI